MKKLIAIDEHSYSFADGFALGGIMQSKGNKMMDWETVKELIDSKEYTNISVGLAEDWNCTSAEIYNNGVIGHSDWCCFYGASSWATPAVKLTTLDGKTELYECYVDGENASMPSWIPEIEEE